VAVELNQQVKKGGRLLAMEAMKMQSTVYAPAGGNRVGRPDQKQAPLLPLVPLHHPCAFLNGNQLIRGDVAHTLPRAVWPPDLQIRNGRRA
jgi:hypothetical protein